MEGNVVLEQRERLNFMNVMPTIIEHSEDAKFVVFSKFTEGDAGPATYFYSLGLGREVLRVAGAEAFIDYYLNPSDPEDKGNCIFLTNGTLYGGKVKWNHKEQST